MFVPLWILIPAALLLLILLARSLAGGGREMVERQRGATFEPGADHLAALAQPEVREAIARGRKIEAIRLVRERTGLGLREAKLLVDRRGPH